MTKYVIPKQMGRPTELNDIVAQRVMNAVRKGVTREGAAKAAGVSRTTIQNWIARGKAGEQPYLDFVVKIRAEEAALEDRLVVALEELAIGGDRQALIFLLERRIRGGWAPPPKEQPQVLDKLATMSAEELREEYERTTGRKWGT